MTALPRIAELAATSSGWGFFLCAQKEIRSGRAGDYMTLVLQDTTGEVRAKVFQDVDSLRDTFEAGDFVKVIGRGNLFNQRVELVLDRIRRVDPDRDRADGFREELCIQTAPRPQDEMWRELEGWVAGMSDPHLKGLMTDVLSTWGAKLRVWPAAQTVHHAYRSGLLEHVLQIITVATKIAKSYGARRDLVIAGAIMHDIGKLEELDYQVTTSYSLSGNLLGHIVIGAGMLREAIAGRPEFPRRLALELEHLVLSHHGTREHGSPVEPLTIEAFILAAVDDLDARINQMRRHLGTDETPGPFTAYHPRLKRVFLKPESGDDPSER